MNVHIFREYDIRGRVPADLNPDVVYILGRGIGAYYRRHGKDRAAIGRDCRLSSPSLQEALMKGLRESGISVVDIGMVGTPLTYFSLFHIPIEAGVQITGSHNPPDENGLKICLGKTTIHGEEIQEIRKIIESESFVDGEGQLDTLEIIPDYQKYVRENLKPGPRKLKAVVDAGNGTGGIIAVPIYRALGFDIIELFCEPDGTFPNHHPDPTLPENLETMMRTIREEKADLGIAFDGDADRIGVVDDAGNIIWGDRLLAIFSRHILKDNPGATIVSEVKCSQTLFDDIRKHGGNPIMWKAGHSLIKAKMKEENALLGGEMSGHMFFSHRYFGYDDAIYTAGRLLELLSHTDRKLSEILSDLPETVTTPEIRRPCPDEKKFQVVQELVENFRRDYEVIDVDGARVLFDHGWGLVRASNTQPVLVLRFEATDKEQLEKIQNIFEEKLSKYL